MIAIARATKDVGLHMPLTAFDFEEAVIVGLQGASFANDVDVNEKGQKSGFRSQSGRLVCLAGPAFKTTKLRDRSCYWTGTARRSNVCAEARYKRRR